MKIIESQGSVSFHVKVQPRSASNEIVGIEGDTLKVKLTSPPVEGKANESLIEFLSETLDAKRSSIKIVQGSKTRIKLLKIANMTKDQLLQKLHI